MPPKRSRRSKAVPAPLQGVSAGVQAQTAALNVSTYADVEAMAQALEAHPDYRVQRRLKPTLHWPGTVTAGSTMKRVVVLDTETTGLDSSKDKIIELALLSFDVDTATGLPVGDVQVYDGLQDPGIPIPAEVVAITGICDADVRGRHLDEQRITQLLEGVDLVIAHNAGFDRPFVEARLSQFQKLNWACSFSDIDWKEQGRSSSKLESLALAQNFFYEAHRAEMDCHALLAVLVARLAMREQTGLLHLLHSAQKPSYRLQASHAPFDAKDKLKARGYRWNPEQKVWYIHLDGEAALEVECDWLKPNVYKQRAVVIQVEKQTAAVKYSTRPGETIYRQL